MAKGNSHNILTIFYFFPNFSFTANEKRNDYYLKHGINEFLHELPNELRFRILGNYKKSEKSLYFIE